jgi:hypothetical protein
MIFEITSAVMSDPSSRRIVTEPSTRDSKPTKKSSKKEKK